MLRAPLLLALAPEPPVAHARAMAPGSRRILPARSPVCRSRRGRAADAADLVWHMAGRYWPPDALRRADTLAQADPPAAMTTRQPN
jgi:hypothetical protein